MKNVNKMDEYHVGGRTDLHKLYQAVFISGDFYEQRIALTQEILQISKDRDASYANGQISPKGVVLDIGCGSGIFSFLNLAKKEGVTKVIAYDNNKNIEYPTHEELRVIWTKKFGKLSEQQEADLDAYKKIHFINSNNPKDILHYCQKTNTNIDMMYSMNYFMKEGDIGSILQELKPVLTYNQDSDCPKCIIELQVGYLPFLLGEISGDIFKGMPSSQSHIRDPLCVFDKARLAAVQSSGNLVLLYRELSEGIKEKTDIKGSFVNINDFEKIMQAIINDHNNLYEPEYRDKIITNMKYQHKDQYNEFSSGYSPDLYSFIVKKGLFEYLPQYSKLLKDYERILTPYPMRPIITVKNDGKKL